MAALWTIIAQGRKRIGLLVGAAVLISAENSPGFFRRELTRLDDGAGSR
jgi:hypothetical protein